MTASNTPLLQVLEQIHELEAQGILDDLLAPKRVERTGDEEVDQAAMEKALLVSRAARRDAERLLQRNSITARVAQDDEARSRLAAAVASKLGEFRSLPMAQRQARAKELVLPSSARTITLAGESLP
ncbi:MAG: hypothetical protein FJ083_13920, partial [Cyanobacteria bacterium K_Offshore_surface_m2_239]|nr:hypothetical protein [Cyanobacteria bacterium K_Offshore_surface_m2_239]